MREKIKKHTSFALKDNYSSITYSDVVITVGITTLLLFFANVTRGQVSNSTLLNDVEVPTAFYQNNNLQEKQLTTELAFNSADRPLEMGLPRAKKDDKEIQSTTEKALEYNQILRFEQNKGQENNSAVLYKANDAQATHFFLKNEVRSVVLNKEDSLMAGYALQFIAPNENLQVLADGRINSKLGQRNYINDLGVFSDVASFTKLKYAGIWSGVDAMFYEQEGNMKYDFVVQPNADPSQVRFRIDGATDLSINKNGELEFTSAFGKLQKGKPYTYQTINGKQVEVACHFVLENGEVSFRLGNYNHNLPLIIDPIALKWSSFLGSGAVDTPYDIYVHPTTGRIYITGGASAADFPNTLGRPFGGVRDAFVTCIEKDGASIVWSTYLGGSGYDVGTAIFVDENSDVYVTGITSSVDFPINGSVAAYDATYNGGTYDMFVTRLSSTGTTIKYSTYLGSSEIDGGSRRLSVHNGVVMGSGYARGTNFPTTPGAFVSSVTNNTANKGVWFKLNTNIAGATGLEYSSYFADALSTIREMAEDPDGNIWFIGNTVYSPTTPISPNAAQKYGEWGGPENGNIDYVFKVSSSGDYLYSSYVAPMWIPDSTIAIQSLNSIDVDAQGNLYIGIGTRLHGKSTQVVKAPNIGVFNELVPFNQWDTSDNMQFAFFTKIPYNLAPVFEFVSILPVSAPTNSGSPKIDVDKKGNIHIALPGNTNNAALNLYHPFTPGALSTTVNSGVPVNMYFVLNPTGSSTLYGTVLGSTASFVPAMFVNDKCETYITNIVNSNQTLRFPLTPSYRDYETNTQKNVFDPTHNGTEDVGLLVFHEPQILSNTITDFVAGNKSLFKFSSLKFL